MNHWTEKLITLNACAPAVEWCLTQPDLPTAWAKCERPDWMLWLAAHSDDQLSSIESLLWEFADRALRVLSPAEKDAAESPEFATRLRGIDPVVDAETARSAMHIAFRLYAGAAGQSMYSATLAVANLTSPTNRLREIETFFSNCLSAARNAEAEAMERTYQLARIRETIECPVI